MISEIPEDCNAAQTTLTKKNLIQLFFIPQRKKDACIDVTGTANDSTTEISLRAYTNGNENDPGLAKDTTVAKHKKKQFQKDLHKMHKQVSLNKRYKTIIDFLQHCIQEGSKNTLGWCRDNFSITSDTCKVSVCIEGYAYNANTGGSAKLHELGGIVKQYLYDHNIPYLEVSPTSVKKFFTGKGTSDKLAMYREFSSRVDGFLLLSQFGHAEPNAPGLTVPNPVQDLVDATALAFRAKKCFEELNRQNELLLAHPPIEKKTKKKRKRSCTNTDPFFDDVLLL